MKREEFEEKQKRAELVERQNYIECINPECEEVLMRHKGIELENPLNDNQQLLVINAGFGNQEIKESSLVCTQVCSRKCGYYMSKDEEQDELNTCDNETCSNDLRMDEVNHDTSPEEAKKIHEEMGHVVTETEDGKPCHYYCSEECAVADQL